MTIDKYNYYLSKTKKDFKTLIKTTQDMLNKSKTKDSDYDILCNFWKKFTNNAIKKWDDSSTLFLDDESMFPMPDSVAKQFCNMLFKIKNIDLLFDLGINQGLYRLEWDDEEDEILC